MNNDKIKELLDAGFAIEDFIRQVLGGMNVFKVPSYMMQAMSLFGKVKVAVGDAAAALKQYREMDDETAKDVEAYVVQHYGSTPDTVDQVIESVLELLIHVHRILGLLGK